MIIRVSKVVDKKYDCSASEMGCMQQNIRCMRPFIPLLHCAVDTTSSAHYTSQSGFNIRRLLNTWFAHHRLINKRVSTPCPLTFFTLASVTLPVRRAGDEDLLQRDAARQRREESTGIARTHGTLEGDKPAWQHRPAPCNHRNHR
jgi:hypothetical protein